MWNYKSFKTFAAQQSWITANEGRYRIVVLYVNNGYAVEWRKLLRPRLPR